MALRSKPYHYLVLDLVYDPSRPRSLSPTMASRASLGFAYFRFRASGPMSRPQISLDLLSTLTSLRRR
jgi:hypothetical protein